MASCGIRPNRPGCGRIKALTPVLASIALIFLLAGCAPTLEYGSMPKTDRLDTLKTGVSTDADVRLALGEPRGYGKGQLDPNFGLRDIWFYEYTKAKGKKIELDILLVFFNKEAYDGYLWFSSTELIERRD